MKLPSTLVASLLNTWKYYCHNGLTLENDDQGESKWNQLQPDREQKYTFVTKFWYIKICTFYSKMMAKKSSPTKTTQLYTES